MLIGPNIIKQCNFCACCFYEPNLRSGNTFGATYWTDGKREARSLPNLPALVICPHCDAFLWLEDVPKIESTIAAKNVAAYKQLGISEMLRALQLGVANTPSRMRYLRIHLWWAGNDLYRNTERVFLNRTIDDDNQAPYIHDLAVNMDVLSTLLSDTVPEERLMKAELMREMGKLDQVPPLLAFRFANQLLHAANRIGALASDGVTQVEKL